MDRFVVKGLKKLFSLANTKLTLARKADTVDAKPKPLALVERFSNTRLYTVEDCVEHVQLLKKQADYRQPYSIASTVIQLCDIIESVKYEFEPPEYMPLIDKEKLDGILNCLEEDKDHLRIFLMTKEAQDSSFYIGDDPPASSWHFSRVVSGIAPLLSRIYLRNNFSDGIRLKNSQIVYGGRNLLGCSVNFSLNQLLESGG